MNYDPTTHGPIQVVRKDELSVQTEQSQGALRLSGIDSRLDGVDAIWMGKVSNKPGHWSLAHHHGEAQTAGYLLSGRARIYFGADYKEYVDMNEGDFVFVPPYFPHIEGNLSDTEGLVWLTARAPGNIVVNLATPPWVHTGTEDA